MSVSATSTVCLGLGSIFASNSSKSDQYCTPSPIDDPVNGEYTIFLCRVALGEPYQTKTAMPRIRRSPPIPGKDGAVYDSVVGEVGAGRYLWCQTHPEYVL